MQFETRQGVFWFSCRGVILVGCPYVERLAAKQGDKENEEITRFTGRHRCRCRAQRYVHGYASLGLLRDVQAFLCNL